MGAATVAAINPTGTESMQPATHHTLYDLGALKLDDVLQEMQSTPFGRLTFFDSVFEPIGREPDAVNLCYEVSKMNMGPDSCNQCPVRARMQTGENNVVQERCFAGVARTIAPILVHGERIGWVSGPQHLEQTFFKLNYSHLSEELRKHIAERAVAPWDGAAVRSEVEKAARSLSERCLVIRRDRLVRDTSEQLSEAQNANDVIAILFRALETLLGRVSEILLCRAVPGANPPRNELIRIQGVHSATESHVLPAGRGHIGKVIESRQSRYDPALSNEDPDFVPTRPGPLPRSVLTVPLQWGGTAAAVQARSEVLDAFAESDRDAAELLIARAGNAATRFYDSEQRRLTMAREGVKTPWDEFLVGVLLGETNNPFDLLALRHSCYKRFAQEVYVRSLPNCIAASFRILNPRSGFLGYAACEGPAWTQAAQDTIYTEHTRSVGLAALKQKEPIYLPDTSQSSYEHFLERTRSVWAKGIWVRGKARSVVTVSWNSVDGGSSEVIEKLEQLTRQIEDVLNALSVREEALFRELENPFASPQDIPEISRRLCDQLTTLFAARACSLFLDSNHSERFVLSASTHPGLPENVGKISYEPGVGITGWVARHRRSVRLRNTQDPQELERVRALHTVKDPIVWEEHWREAIEYPEGGQHSFLAAPLLARNRVLGVIRLTIKNDLSEFTQEDETFLQEVADRLAKALDAIWRDAEATEKIREVEQHARFAEELEKAQSLQAICAVLAQEIFLGTRAVGVYIKVVDSHFSGLAITESVGLFKIIQAEGLDLPVFLNSIDSSDVWAEPAWDSICRAVRNSFGEDAGNTLKSGAVVRLERAPFGCMGSICIAWNDPDHNSADWTGVYTTFAARASSAINRAVKQARLQFDLDRKLEEFTRLREIGLDFNLQSDIKALMASILTAALNESKMDRGTVRLYDEDKKLWKSMASHEFATDDEVPDEIESDVTLRQCLEGGIPVVTAGDDPDWRDYIRALPEGPRKNYLAKERSRIGIPLKLAETFIGAILLSSLNEVQSITRDTIEYLEILSQYASFAIYSAQLHQKEIELAQPFALIGAMLAGFLHVMGNKLNNAWATFSNLSDPLLPASERGRKLDDLRSDLKRVTDICRDLGVGFSPQKEASRQRVDVNALTDKAWNDSPGPRIERINRQLVYEKPAPIVLGNEMQLEIAIRMLIQNAVDAIEGEGQVWLQTKKTARSIVIRVCDNGVGMDRETLRNCTRPFFTTKGNAGNGLGLAVVLGIVTRHHGKLRIHSKPGRGSIFSLVFPA
jgi:signal transduction histidine kinase